MTNQQLKAPTLKAPLTFSQQEIIQVRLRFPGAQAYGIDAIVQLAISEGELAPDQLENLGILTSRLAETMQELQSFVSDLGIVPANENAGGRHE